MDEMTRLLLSHVAGDDVETPALAFPDLIEQSLGDDPIAVPLAAALRRRAERATEAAEDERALQGSANLELPTNPELADLLERLYEELEVLRQRSRTLADALGACPRCWGKDELCRLCRGHGRSGGRQPDVVLFAELVEPARRRLGAPVAELRTLTTPQAHQP